MPSTTWSSSAAAWPAPGSRAIWPCAACRSALIEQGDFASATTSPVVEADPRRPALSRAVRLLAWCANRSASARRCAVWRPTSCGRCRSWCRSTGSRRAASSRCASGLKLYDWLAPGRDRERYRVLPAVDALSLEPALRARDLRGAGYYFDDLLVYPERLCLENVLSACRLGRAGLQLRRRWPRSSATRSGGSPASARATS